MTLDGGLFSLCPNIFLKSKLGPGFISVGFHILVLNECERKETSHSNYLWRRTSIFIDSVHKYVKFYIIVLLYRHNAWVFLLQMNAALRSTSEQRR